MILPARYFVPALTLLLPLFGARAQEDARSNPGLGALRQLNDGLVSIYEKVAPSVVVIEVTKPDPVAGEIPENLGLDFLFRDPGRRAPGPQDPGFHMPRRPPESEGSGVIVRQDGYILTNYHVVEGADTIRVRLKNGRAFPAKIVGGDDKTDIAVIKVEAEGLPAAELADSDQLKVGQIVCAIGAPYNLDYTFTVGVISALGRSDLQQAAYEEYIQSDVSINPGNSGGPLCDIEGRVIGINTLINGINRGLSFAIPINMADEIGTQLIASGRIVRPWLGIRIQSLADRLTDEPSLKNHFEGIDRGVVVETIEPDTPAYKSDLRPADVITKVDGTFVATARDLQREILKKKVGQEVELTVWRNGKSVRVTLRTGELPTDIRQALNVPQEEPSKKSEESLMTTLGVSVQNLTPELAQSLGIEQASGVLITEVIADSPAEIAGLQPHDVITEVNGKSVQNTAEFKEAVKLSDPARGALLFIDRSGDKTYAVLKSED